MIRTTLPTLAALATLAGCARETHDTASPAARTVSTPPAALADGHVSREELDAATDELRKSLTRLVALQISDVGGLISTAPEGAMNCYGPCEDDPAAQAWMQDQVVKIDRFHALVGDAEALVRADKSSEAQATVKELVALQLVEIEVRAK